ncbi:Golgi-associated kinase 1A-like isoform X2 [Ptychodera flava]|uniref:Golgi-associated kinase 1A-like isoform X2 n=1 Tax=Ptychodera flava TaxID=63121 RepID=UPI00396A6CEB
MTRRYFLVVFLLCCTIVATLMLYSSILTSKNMWNVAFIISTRYLTNFQNQSAASLEFTSRKSGNTSSRGNLNDELLDADTGDDGTSSGKKRMTRDQHDEKPIDQRGQDHSKSSLSQVNGRKGNRTLTNWWELMSEDEFVSFVKGLKNEELRFDENYPKWFSRADVVRMEMLSTSNISKLYNGRFKVRLRQLIFDDGRSDPIKDFDSCTEQCAIQKRVDDWFEIFAFHLDRVLGINRSLPAIARVLTPKMFPRKNRRIMDGKLRPLLWWDPKITHGGTLLHDQNSFGLYFTEYQTELKYRCNSLNENKNKSHHCKTKIKHIEWSKLSIFDFLLQNHDRLDRNCCGYDVSQGELCWKKKGVRNKCGNVSGHFLVHIFTRKEDPSRLVYIDNMFNINRTLNHLNYRLLEGIREVPEGPINVLKSGKLRDRLKESLQVDVGFWKSLVGENSADALIDIIERRAEILLRHIEEYNIALVPDY